MSRLGIAVSLSGFKIDIRKTFVKGVDPTATSVSSRKKTGGDDEFVVQAWLQPVCFLDSRASIPFHLYLSIHTGLL